MTKPAPSLAWAISRWTVQPLQSRRRPAVSSFRARSRTCWSFCCAVPAIRSRKRACSSASGGDGSGAEHSIVWVYISYLRRKLQALRADVRIRAVPGAGYLLEACP